MDLTEALVFECRPQSVIKIYKNCDKKATIIFVQNHSILGFYQFQMNINAYQHCAKGYTAFRSHLSSGIFPDRTHHRICPKVSHVFWRCRFFENRECHKIEVLVCCLLLPE